jgi:hypothetical protein
MYVFLLIAVRIGAIVSSKVDFVTWQLGVLPDLMAPRLVVDVPTFVSVRGATWNVHEEPTGD